MVERTKQYAMRIKEISTARLSGGILHAAQQLDGTSVRIGAEAGCVDPLGMAAVDLGLTPRGWTRPKTPAFGVANAERTDHLPEQQVLR